jgi:Rrf2 family protein
MRATQQLKYAIYGIFDLAYHGSNRPIRIQEIGRRQRIPARYLEQIFQRLRRAGLVGSKRGPGGGVAVAVEGSILSGFEADGDAPSESPTFLWLQLRETLASALEGTSIADLCREATERGLERADPDASMYYI